MNRIKIFQNYWGRPTESDFEHYNAQILLDRLHHYYLLKDDGKPGMIFPYQIDEIARRNNTDTHFKEAMCKVIDDLPEKIWQQVIKELNIRYLS